MQLTTSATSKNCYCEGDGCNAIFDESFKTVTGGIFTIIIGIMGVIGNCLALGVLIKFPKKTSNNLILIGLAIYDLMVLLLVMLLKGFPTFLETSYHVYFLPIFHPLMNIAWTGSIFFTVFMTLERFIAVTQPMKSKGLFDLQKVKYQMGLITLFVIIYNIPRFIEYKWKDIRIRSAYDPEGIEKPEFRQREEYINWENKAYENITEVAERSLLCNQIYVDLYLTWMNFIVRFVIPTIILIFCNVKILNEVKKIHGNIASFMGSKSQTQLEREASIAIMTTIVVVVFVVCNSFESILFILHSQELLTGDVVQDYLRPLADLVMVFNSSVNVIIYCIFNRAFREKFIEMYFFWCKKKGKESAVEIPMGAQSVPKSSTQATKSSDVVSHSKEQQDTPL